MSIIKRLLALTLSLSMLFSLCACGKSSPDDDEETIDGVPKSTEGKDVTRAAAVDHVFSLNCDPDYSFNPIIATNHSNQLVCNLVYENMVELSNSFEALPGVLSSWRCNEDATSWTFDIDPGHTFHDGSPVTGKDIRYSLDRAVMSDRYSGRFASYQGAGYDDERFYVTLGIGNTQLPKLLNIPIVKTGTFDDKKPLGSGPFMYNEAQDGLIAYEGHRDYANLPVKEVFLVEFTDAASRISAFDNGLIDFVSNDPSSYTNLGYASTSEIHNYSTTNYHFVMFNEESALGKFNGFRQAMSYAFDRAYFVELMQGNAVASTLPMYPSCADYPSDYAASLSFNLELCKLVLENSSIRDYDDDGYLEYMSGTPQEIELNFIVCSDSSVKTGVVNRFQQDMESIGIKVNVLALTWEEYLLALEEGEFDMFYGEVRLRNDFDVTELLDVDSDLNFSRGRDPAFVTLINTYLGTSDMQRMVAFQQLCQYIHETGSLISIGFEQHQIITHRGVIRGLDPNAGNPMYSFANWEIMLD